MFLLTVFVQLSREKTCMVRVQGLVCASLLAVLKIKYLKVLHNFTPFDGYLPIA
jgi:hypothetical protein